MRTSRSPVHRPPFLGRCLVHLLLDLVSSASRSRPSALLRTLSCQAPARATEKVVAIFPAETEFLGMPTGLHHIHVELGRREGLRLAHQGREKARGGVEFMLRLRRLASERRWGRFTP